MSSHNQLENKTLITILLDPGTNSTTLMTYCKTVREWRKDMNRKAANPLKKRRFKRKKQNKENMFYIP